MSDEKSIEELISASSLGTPEAVAIREQADPAAVARVLSAAEIIGNKVREGEALIIQRHEDKLWTKCETQEWPDDDRWVQLLIEYKHGGVELTRVEVGLWNGRHWLSPLGNHVEYVTAWRELADPPSWVKEVHD